MYVRPSEVSASVDQHLGGWCITSRHAKEQRRIFRGAEESVRVGIGTQQEYDNGCVFMNRSKHERGDWYPIRAVQVEGLDIDSSLCEQGSNQ